MDLRMFLVSIDQIPLWDASRVAIVAGITSFWKALWPEGGPHHTVEGMHYIDVGVRRFMTKADVNMLLNSEDALSQP